MAPVPRPPHRFWRWGNRWMTISRHPGSSADPRPSLPVSPAHCVPFARSVRRRLSTADARSELGPRSLDPDRSFWSAFAELIRDQTQLDDFCNCTTTCEQPNPGSCDPRRDGDLDLLPFLDVPCPRLASRMTRGEPRYVRSSRPQCWFLSLARVCPTVMPDRTPHLRGLTLRSIVRINVHGPKNRAKDASPYACTVCRACVGCMRFVAHADDVPLLGALRASAVTGACLS